MLREREVLRDEQLPRQLPHHDTLDLRHVFGSTHLDQLNTSVLQRTQPFEQIGIHHGAFGCAVEKLPLLLESPETVLQLLLGEIGVVQVLGDAAAVESFLGLIGGLLTHQTVGGLLLLRRILRIGVVITTSLNGLVVVLGVTIRFTRIAGATNGRLIRRLSGLLSFLLLLQQIGHDQPNHVVREQQSVLGLRQSFDVR